MKKLLLLLCVCLSVVICTGQALLGKVEYQRSKQSAAIIELPYSPQMVEGAIKDHLSKKGSKPGQSKGFLLFKNVPLTLSDPGPSDVYFKIDTKSRKENDKSVVYMMVAKPNENVATRSGEDIFGMQQAQSFLNDMEPLIEAYSLNVQIKDQQENIKKVESKYNGLVNDGQDLEKKRKAIEDKILENKSDQEKQRLELEKQKEVLQTLTAKVKG